MSILTGVGQRRTNDQTRDSLLRGFLSRVFLLVFALVKDIVVLEVRHPNIKNKHLLCCTKTSRQTKNIRPTKVHGLCYRGLSCLSFLLTLSWNVVPRRVLTTLNFNLPSLLTRHSSSNLSYLVSRTFQVSLQSLYTWQER